MTIATAWAWMAALLFVIFLAPGWLLTGGLGVGRSPLPLERLGAAVVLSMAIVAITGVVLNALNVPIDRESMTIAMGVLAVAVAAARTVARLLDKGNRPVPSLERHDLRAVALPLVAAVGLFAAVGLVALTKPSPAVDHYTELYLTDGKDGFVQNALYVSSGQLNAFVTIANREGAPMAYRYTISTGATSLGSGTVTIADGDQVKWPITASLQEGGVLVVDLWTAGGSTPYREVRVPVFVD